MHHLYDVSIKTEKESLWILTIADSYNHAIIKASYLLHGHFVRMQARLRRHSLINLFEAGNLKHLGDSLTDNSLYAEKTQTLCATSEIWRTETEYTNSAYGNNINSFNCWIVCCSERNAGNQNIIGANYYLGLGRLSEKDVLMNMIEKDKEFRYDYGKTLTTKATNAHDTRNSPNKTTNIELARINLQMTGYGLTHILHREYI